MRWSRVRFPPGSPQQLPHFPSVGELLVFLSRIGRCHSLGWRVQGAFSPLLLDDLSPYRTSAPTASAQCERVTRHSHEKAGPCQAIFLVVSTVHQTAEKR